MSGRKSAITSSSTTSFGSESSVCSSRPTGVPKRSGQYPARTPKSAPSTRLTETDSRPGRKNACVPTMTRDSRSRPTKSVPSRCAALGSALIDSRSIASGSTGSAPTTEQR